MSSFGASGPIEKLYPHFGITAKHVLQAVNKKKR
jgi:transketolase